MPKEKDLKRVVRTRMSKTGESYTAARLQVLQKKEKPAAYAQTAGMSDASVRKATGRSWAEWARLLDAAGAMEKPHREIARHLTSLGVPAWWSQMVTVGYERIRGLRERGQRRAGTFEASKSRTFAVPLARLYDAFAKPAMRRKWLDAKVEVKSRTEGKRMRVVWEDGTSVQIGFYDKGPKKSMVAIQHEKLPDRSSAEEMKRVWADALDRLRELFKS